MASLVGKVTLDHRVAGSSPAGFKANNQNNLTASKKPDLKEAKLVVIQPLSSFAVLADGNTHIFPLPLFP